jgi:CheY-like chemotaxis protein
VSAVKDALAAGRPFQLILLDQMMPGVSGAEAAREILALPMASPPAMVMASSMSEPLTARQADEIGLAAVLVKPVRHEALISTLCEALGVEGSAPAGDVAAEPGSGALAADAHCGRVLLAEDNEINTLLARTMLEQVGFSVACVTNGREAVEAAGVETFDLILMDLQMPEMDGLEATRRIRDSGGPNAGTPIVAMTANAMRRDRDLCMEAGMNDFVSKPVDPQVFFGVLERLLDADQAQPGSGVEVVNG